MRNKLETVAIRLIEKDGLINLTATAICKKAGVPLGSFTHHLQCSFSAFIDELRNAGHVGAAKKVKVGRVHSKELRCEYILDKATLIARKDGCKNMKRAAVAKASGISETLLSRYFTMKELKKQVVTQAVAQRDFKLLAHIVNDDSTYYKIPRAVRAAAVKHAGGK